MKSENCIDIDYTYCGPNQSISVTDHCIICGYLSSSIAVYKQSAPCIIFLTMYLYFRC